MRRTLGNRVRVTVIFSWSGGMLCSSALTQTNDLYATQGLLMLSKPTSILSVYLLSVSVH